MAIINSAKDKFFQSCTTGDLNTIKTQMFYNVSPLSQDKYGNNAVHLACMNNQPKVLEYILSTVKTFKNDVQNKLGRTALNIAASQGAFECVNILLSNLDCDINSTDKTFKNTPLHWCVTRKCIKGVEKLLNIGADYMLVNKLGQTPLQLAKTTCLNIYHLIDQFIKDKNKDQNLPGILQMNKTSEMKNNITSESSYTSQFKIIEESPKMNSKIFKQTANQKNSNCQTYESDLTSNNSEESFFLDISKLKHGDNSVLNLLEKSIEPVDETSFVSSILNSGKVIQLTEAGILALEYTKNEINTPIPDRLVKSFLTTTQLHNENHFNDTSGKCNEFDPKTSPKGSKRTKSPPSCSKRLKYTETITNKISEFENFLEQLSSESLKSTHRVNSFDSYYSQTSTNVKNNAIKNNEICNQNQLMCLNSDNGQLKWIEDLMCLLHNSESSDVLEQKLIKSV